MSKKSEKTGKAIVIGAGPAGLTAAYEFLLRSSIKPILIEAESQVGGISKTVNYKGNRIDIGGHRFFSKSDRVMNWWLSILSLDEAAFEDSANKKITYQNKQHYLNLDGIPRNPRPGSGRMLLRKRVSRILFEKKFYNYPISLSSQTLRNLGFIKAIKIGLSYLYSMIKPIKSEKNLSDFIINRFGRELYQTFFKDYTEKVWGVPCSQIPANWGAQRIKGLSISKIFKDIFRRICRPEKNFRQKRTETSLIEQFLYPEFGPGQLWDEVADRVRINGGELHLESKVIQISHKNYKIKKVTIKNAEGEISDLEGDYFFSTMPVSELFEIMCPPLDPKLTEIAGKLPYRDFITVGLLLDKILLDGEVKAHQLSDRLPDNWIYVQEPYVKVGRIQIFNNWSPSLVADKSKIWIGLEYFLNQNDKLWQSEDSDIVSFAINELQELGFCSRNDIKDAVVVRTPKAYPAYFGTYEKFGSLQEEIERFDNLFCIGRNGMHRYNNQDHSMLSAMMAIDGILQGRDNRQELWKLNTEMEYHEDRTSNSG